MHNCQSHKGVEQQSSVELQAPQRLGSFASTQKYYRHSVFILSYYIPVRVILCTSTCKISRNYPLRLLKVNNHMFGGDLYCHRAGIKAQFPK